MPVIISTPTNRLEVANGADYHPVNVAKELNAVLLAAGWTAVGNTDFTKVTTNPSVTNSSVFTNLASPVQNLPVYKMNDSLANTGSSPWYINFDVRSGTTLETHTVLLITTGTGVNVSYQLIGGGTQCGNPSGTNYASFQNLDWYINAYESGFTIYSSANGAVATGDVLINVERGRSFTGVLENTIIITGGLTNIAIGEPWTGLITNSATGSPKCMSLVRDWTAGEYPQGSSSVPLNSSLMLAPIYWQSGTSGDSPTYLPTYSFNTPGNTSGIALGPFPYGGGPHGMPRLYYFGSYANINYGTVINTIQDGQTRKFYCVTPVNATTNISPHWAKVLFAIE